MQNREHTGSGTGLSSSSPLCLVDGGHGKLPSSLSPSQSFQNPFSTSSLTPPLSPSCLPPPASPLPLLGAQQARL